MATLLTPPKKQKPAQNKRETGPGEKKKGGPAGAGDNRAGKWNHSSPR